MRRKVRLTQGELAQRAGVSKSLLAQVEAQMKPLTVKSAKKIARALGCRPVDILEPDPELLADTAHAPAGVGKATRVLPVIGYVQAGDWREATEWPHDDRFDVPVAADIEGSFVLEVKGDSMNLRFAEGTLLICLPFNPLHDNLPVDRYVIVERRDFATSLYEATCKRLARDAEDRLWLEPESSDRNYQPVEFYDGDADVGDRDTRILAIVTGAIERL